MLTDINQSHHRFQVHNHHHHNQTSRRNHLNTVLNRPLGLNYIQPLLLVILIYTLLFTHLTPIHAAILTAIPTGVHSTAFTFKVTFDSQTQVGDSLTVRIQPDGSSASESTVNIPELPMQATVSNLLPNSIYTFQFTTQGQTITSPSLRTPNSGPQIVGLVASPASNQVTDTGFQAGDQLTLIFDSDTNMPAADTTDKINALFAFSQTIGASYTGQWLSAQKLLITVTDAGSSSPPLGLLIARIISGIHAPDGRSDINMNPSPPLIGSWSGRGTGAVDYFQPATGGSDYSSYQVSTEMNTDAKLPMTLNFPSTAPSGGYQVVTILHYPMDGQEGFELKSNQISNARPSVILSTPIGTSNSALVSIVPTITLTPKKDYVGWSSVSYDLVDTNSNAIVSTVYVNAQFTNPHPTTTPIVSNGVDSTEASSSSSSNPFTSFFVRYRDPIIIAACCLVGLLIIGYLIGRCVMKKYRLYRERQDFEHTALKDEPTHRTTSSMSTTEGGGEEPKSDRAKTKRFYFDSHV